jgi:ATP-dependent Lhr-like helicase
MKSLKFHPVVAKWFAQRFGSPTAPQQSGWPAIQSGSHVLMAAPTGSGKTLAAFLASLDQLFRLGLEGQLRDEIYVVYVSPLKALSNDIHKNLDEPLTGIREAFKKENGRDIEVRSAVRTGDTPAAERLAIIKRPPHILVTTPESFYLLLTSVSGRAMLATVRTLIVDEIHAVVGNRRGSHLALSMERLANLTGQPLQRIGLSATQKPIEEVAKFLVGTRPFARKGKPGCKIIDIGHRREMDLAIELPGSPLEAVMSNEVWTEVYHRLAELIQAHRTTLVFVNTRRLAERVTAHLGELLGREHVASHHGSLSTKLRLEAESRLKRGELKVLVATSSLELGIDIGSVELVCQIGSIRSIATCLQRVGRAGHHRGGVPKGRLFPLTRDELVECVAVLQCIRRGDLDRLHIPEKARDILAQQIVACAAVEEWTEDNLLALVQGAFPYRHLTREEFVEILRMLNDGFSTKRGRRAALIHYDTINHRIRGRRGARLTALTSGGAIPDNSDYRVVVEPAQTFIGTVNEDFAVESIAGDIFQLGNASWKIIQVSAGTVRVEDAHGQPPGIPFWLGEAPARTAELSHAISGLDENIAARIADELKKRAGDREASLAALADWLLAEAPLSRAGALQLAAYFYDAYRSLGALPAEQTIIMERFFDESGGMQLVIHSRFGARLNRAWGLALRKRFCRSFNFELQSAATDDAIVLSLGTQHSFPLEEVFRYLHSNTVREVLVQALLDSPMFPIRWRWNATRSLALPRQRGGRKIAAPLQRMEAENLLAAVFPDQLACPENLGGDRIVPDHPLVRQTIEDCLVEAMDIDGLEELLRRVERGEIQCLARDLPEPSPLAAEILNARPYAFLDNAPLEERRAHAVQTRRASDTASRNELGILDGAAIEQVCAEAWPKAQNVDELQDALLQLGVATMAELQRCHPEAKAWLELLARDRRAGRLNDPAFWFATERAALVQHIYPQLKMRWPEVTDGVADRNVSIPETALREIVRGRMEIVGPVTSGQLADFLYLPVSMIEQSLLALEAEGFILRGKFHPSAKQTEWCDRRLLARIHRLTLNRLRAEIQPVSVADFQRFLLSWQHVDKKMENGSGVEAILNLLDGYELPAAAWEPAVLAARVRDYDPRWLDQLCFTGRFGWGRLSPPSHQRSRAFSPLRSSPISIFSRENVGHWLQLAGQPKADFSAETAMVVKALAEKGALFFGEIVRHTGLLKSRVEEALGELVVHGWVTADSFEGLRALLTPPEKRARFGDRGRPRRHRVVTSIEFAGRWSLLRRYPVAEENKLTDAGQNDEAIKTFARVLLRRYGIMFRKMLDREVLKVSWFELGRTYRQLEARGEIRGGHFISGVSGEQFALPEAIGHLRALKKTGKTQELTALSGSDPLNLIGILTPGPRVAAVWRNRILLRDGVPVAALEAGKVINLNGETDLRIFESALKIGTLLPRLRRYYH